MDQIKTTQLVTLLFAVVIIGLILGCVFIIKTGMDIFKSVPDINDLSHDGLEPFDSCTSANGRYTVDLYYVSLNALSQYGTLGVVTDNKTGQERNIYFSYPLEGVVNMEFRNNKEVIIGNRALDVRYDSFDSRVIEKAK